MKKSALFTLLLGSTWLTLFVGCQDQNSASVSDDRSDVFADLFIDTPPAEAIPVLAARETALPGMEMTIKGKIMGAEEPFTAGFAAFVIADPDILTSCDLIPGDGCETPWDVCCEPTEKVQKARITVQVLDENNNVLDQSIKGANGLKELDHLIVAGSFAPESTPSNIIFNATGIYREPTEL